MPSTTLLCYQFFLAAVCYAWAPFSSKVEDRDHPFTILFDREDGGDLSRKTKFIEKIHDYYNLFCVIWILILTFRHQLFGFRYMRWVLVPYIIISGISCYFVLLSDKRSRKVFEILCLAMEKAGKTSDEVADCRRRTSMKVTTINFVAMAAYPISACRIMLFWAVYRYIASRDRARESDQQSTSRIEKRIYN
ncbi:hypothetical protein FRC18_010468 [Serendipita sp. 400]|nr:hypothetical protein FRC18_010468 [Serendipita sp. 400]